MSLDRTGHLELLALVGVLERLSDCRGDRGVHVVGVAVSAHQDHEEALRTIPGVALAAVCVGHCGSRGDLLAHGSDVRAGRQDNLGLTLGLFAHRPLVSVRQASQQASVLAQTVPTSSNPQVGQVLAALLLSGPRTSLCGQLVGPSNDSLGRIEQFRKFLLEPILASVVDEGLSNRLRAGTVKGGRLEAVRLRDERSNGDELACARLATEMPETLLVLETFDLGQEGKQACDTDAQKQLDARRSDLLEPLGLVPDQDGLIALTADAAVIAPGGIGRAERLRDLDREARHRAEDVLHAVIQRSGEGPVAQADRLGTGDLDLDQRLGALEPELTQGRDRLPADLDQLDLGGDASLGRTLVQLDDLLGRAGEGASGDGERAHVCNLSLFLICCQAI